MAPSRSLLRPVREVVFRSRPQIAKSKIVPPVQTRHASNGQPKTTPLPPGSKGPNEDQLPHVTEEQAAIDKTMGNTPPDVEQGTPVEEVLQRDSEAQKKAPQVIKDEIKSQSGAGQQRSYTTSARRPALEVSQVSENGMIAGMEYPEAGPGHKFPLPDIAKMSRLDHLKRRYDPVVDQVTKSLMRHGKLSVAQKTVSDILTILRTAPPPQLNPAFPQRTLLLSEGSNSSLRSNSPFTAAVPTTNTNTDDNTPVTIPRSTLPLHPVEYLTTIIDSVSPLVKIRQQKGMAGGGASTPIPIPLGIRQRRRQAIQWILSAADGRRETKLGDRVAKELLRVADGTSGVWERRAMVHRLGISARSNVRASLGRTRRR